MGEFTPNSCTRLLVASVLMLLALRPGRTQTGSVVPPPLGTLADVGGYRVHIYCLGKGSPTVVITGASYSFDWGLVQPEVAKFARVCAYDHSGIAWSDPGPTDTCSVRVNELHAALTNAKISGPYVLVGHSLGALVSRLYASTYQDEVVGMVIVDHAFAAPAPIGPMKISDLSRTLSFGSPGARNIDRPLSPPPRPLINSVDPDLDFQKLPALDYQLHLWANSLPGYSRVMERNGAMMPECISQVESASLNRATPLDDKPLIVVSTSRSNADLQNKLLSLSSNSKHVIVENSGHLIMIDRPDDVTRAIQEVVGAAQHHIRLKN